MLLKTEWGKVSEKLSRYWGNDSEKRQGQGSGKYFVPNVLRRAVQHAGRGDGKQSGSEPPRRPEW